MSVATTICPYCRSSLPSLTSENCPQCGRALRDGATRPLHELNTTTNFSVGVLEGADEKDELVGTQLANYSIERFLGAGGMARVYKAKHLTLERPCAIKVLKPSFAERTEDAAASFLAEARSAAALVHPHVVTIHTIGHDRGQHFIEMELVEGESLASLQHQVGRFDFTEATRLMVQICSALALAHQLGMVHRDIKPANVLVTADRTAKLADFGLAKRVHQKHGDDGHVLTGTPNYMAPELFLGEPADTRSDVYAMGVTYFQLLAGELPFRSESLADLMQAHASEPTPDVLNFRGDTPDNAAQIIRRCLAKEPADRYPHADSLLEELRAAYGSIRTLESLLREALQGTDTTITGQGAEFEVCVRLSNGRRQKVSVEITDSAAIAEQVVRISSICGVADERHFLRALQLNPNFPYGAIGVESIHGVPSFVMTNVYPRATCDPHEIRHGVLGIARYADEGERWLSHEDVY